MSTDTDFFADLERQLVVAAHDRPRRLRRARLRCGATGLATVALLVGGAGAVVIVAAGDDTPSRSAATAPPVPARTVTVDPATGAIPELADVSYAVLNGTAIPGLARGVADGLVTAGLTGMGNVTNAGRQDVRRTRVTYRTGHQREAALVASRLTGYDGDLWPMSRATAAVAGLGADVAVVVGADRADRADRATG